MWVILNITITVIYRIQRMIQCNVWNQHSTKCHNVYMWNDWRPLPEKRAFFKIEIIFFSYVVLDKLRYLHLIHVPTCVRYSILWYYVYWYYYAVDSPSLPPSQVERILRELVDEYRSAVLARLAPGVSWPRPSSPWHWSLGPTPRWFWYGFGQ
jgi:hypothetical protein